MSDVFTTERHGETATVWLDRPEKRNAMGTAFFADLAGVMDDVGLDPDVRAVVLAARGPHFTVGLDLVESGGLLAPADGESRAVQQRRVYQTIKRIQAAITSVADCPKPVIAAVHGWCIGGGIDLITACDIRLASADAKFSVRETRIAIVADVGTLQRLPRVIAPGHVAELVYTGKDIDAARAKEIGLVNDVFADQAACLAAARALADEIAANSPIAVQGAKAVLKAGEDQTVEEGLEHVAIWNSAFLQSDDLTEAITAFFQKREPKFTGR
ncbi:MAG: crotonase/enoyl-CoA hydratase family protein [Acidimicrobiia bacterium]